MNLRDFNILYTKVPDFANLTDGFIFGLYMFFINNKVQFLVETKYKQGNKEKIGLFGIDIENKKIDTIDPNDYQTFLHYIKFVNDKGHYNNIEKYLKENKTYKQIIEYDNYFIIPKENTTIKQYDSDSKVLLKENGNEMQNNIAILYCTPGISKSFFQIQKELLIPDKVNSLNYSTIVELNIKYNDTYYNEFGNIKQIECDNEVINFVIEPLEASLLSKQIMNDVAFNKVSVEEMLMFMVNSTNIFKIGNIENSNNKLRKFKFITTLNNFDIKKDEIIIGDLILSKKIKNIDSTKLKVTSGKFVYISIYVTAENIAEAQKVALIKIRNVVNFIELISKNSSFFELYDTKETLNKWNIEKIFVDYKIGNYFYIFNIFDQSQSIYGSTNSLSIKNYGIIGENSEIIKYINEMENIVYNYNERIDKIFNAVYWLNKGLEEINIDINKCVLYLNIALEYCISGEKGVPFSKQYENSETILSEVANFLTEKFKGIPTAIELNNKIKNISTSSSVRNRFETMLKRLGISYTDKQFDNYDKIRTARNDIIHNGRKVDVMKHDIIDFYMFLSKVMFYKLVEVKNESISENIGNS